MMVFVAFVCLLQADLAGDMFGSSVIMLRTFVFVYSWPHLSLYFVFRTHLCTVWWNGL